MNLIDLLSDLVRPLGDVRVDGMHGTLVWRAITLDDGRSSGESPRMTVTVLTALGAGGLAALSARSLGADRAHLGRSSPSSSEPLLVLYPSSFFTLSSFCMVSTRSAISARVLAIAKLRIVCAWPVDGRDRDLLEVTDRGDWARLPFLEALAALDWSTSLNA